ncbi:MAG: hypothetical protein NT118_11690, partial [Lentisphaerae bacterium]|nr:hypothetical protein [Lentisphaerota bacterium]
IGDKAPAYDAMTPANFDWMYETIEAAAIACRISGSEEVYNWIAAMPISKESLTSKFKLLPELIEAINKDKAENPSVYERLDFFLAVIAGNEGEYNSGVFKEKMRKAATFHYYSTAPSSRKAA